MTVPFARKSMSSQGAKLVISVFGVAAALILMLLLLGFRAGLYASVAAYVKNAGADLFVGQQGATGVVASSSAIPASLGTEIKRASGASRIQPILVADIIFEHEGKKTPVLLVGYVPGQPLGGPWSLSAGREPRVDGAEILLDESLASRDQIQVGEYVSIQGHDLQVVGLTRGTSNWMSPFLFLPQQILSQLVSSEHAVSFFLLDLPAGADAEAIGQRIEASVEDVHAMTPTVLAEHDQSVLAAVMETPLMVMLAISIVIGAAVLGLTSYTAALDRMREYGVLKAIGAPLQTMRLWLFEEALYRGGLGYVLGAVGSLGAARAIEAVWPQFTVRITFASLAFVALALIGMVLLGTLLPLRRIAKLEPAAVFRA